MRCSSRREVTAAVERREVGKSLHNPAAVGCGSPPLPRLCNLLDEKEVRMRLRLVCEKDSTWLALSEHRSFNLLKPFNSLRVAVDILDLKRPHQVTHTQQKPTKLEVSVSLVNGY